MDPVVRKRMLPAASRSMVRTSGPKTCPATSRRALAFFGPTIASRARPPGSATPCDADARVAPADVAQWRAHPNWPNPVLGVALQALLADRFKLAVHRVHAAMPGQVLVVAKRGPQLKPSPA